MTVSPTVETIREFLDACTVAPPDAEQDAMDDGATK